MPTVTRTFSVDAAPGVVVDYLKDFSKTEEWDPGTERCKRIDSGPVAVGASWHNTSKIAGVSTELTYTLRSLTSDELVFVGENDTATSVDTITVRPEGAGSEITYQADLTMHGAAKLGAPLVKVVFEKIGSGTEKQMAEVLNRLPKHLSG